MNLGSIQCFQGRLHSHFHQHGVEYTIDYIFTFNLINITPLLCRVQTQLDTYLHKVEVNAFKNELMIPQHDWWIVNLITFFFPDFHQQKSNWDTQNDKWTLQLAPQSSSPVPSCTCFIPTLADTISASFGFHWYNEQVVSYCAAPLEVQQNKKHF